MTRFPTEVQERFVVRSGIMGNFYVLDRDPGTYSRMEGSKALFRDSFNVVPRRKGSDGYFRTLKGAANFAKALNEGRKTPKYD